MTIKQSLESEAHSSFVCRVASANCLGGTGRWRPVYFNQRWYDYTGLARARMRVRLLDGRAASR